MASTKEFTDYVCDQIRDAGDISSRKMFGEYAVYCDGKVVALICNDQVFVKKSKAATELLGDTAEEGFPYDGAKPHFLITDIDNQQFMTTLIRAIWDELPVPKPKKAKPRKAVSSGGKPKAGKSGKTSPSLDASLAEKITGKFLPLQDDGQAAHLMRFFKTGPGQYGEGDHFLGIKVPVTRSLIKPYREAITLADCDALLDSPWHEIRLAALLLMVDKAKRLARQNDRYSLQELVDLYDRRLERANNWDLIDLSVRDIMGAYWQCHKTTPRNRRRFLKAWGDSGNLWRERAAMVSVWPLQRMGSLDETFWLAEYFIDHQHDLMHKAVGWMLREAGKFDKEALRDFLSKFHKQLPRTALRYAIEHMDTEERCKWMKK